MPKTKERSRIKGTYRLRILENDIIVGDTGWKKNLIVNDGFDQYMCKALGAIAGSKQVSHMALGTGGAPAVADTTLGGEVSKRQAVTAASSSSSKTVRFTATFNSTDSFVTATKNLSNVALVNSSATGTIFCGATYASSSCATNQNVNSTYDVTFS